MLVTFPKGRPSAITSVSDASLGSFLMWRTRDGGASSTFCFLLSLPLEVPSNRRNQSVSLQSVQRGADAQGGEVGAGPYSPLILLTPELGLLYMLSSSDPLCGEPQNKGP